MFAVFKLTEYCKVWPALQRHISKLVIKKPMKNVVLNLAVVLKMYFSIAFLLKTFQNFRNIHFCREFWEAFSDYPKYLFTKHLQRFTNFPGKNPGQTPSISMMQILWKRNRSLLHISDDSFNIVLIEMKTFKDRNRDILWKICWISGICLELIIKALKRCHFFPVFKKRK